MMQRDGSVRMLNVCVDMIKWVALSGTIVVLQKFRKHNLYGRLVEIPDYDVDAVGKSIFPDGH